MFKGGTESEVVPTIGLRSVSRFFSRHDAAAKRSGLLAHRHNHLLMFRPASCLFLFSPYVPSIERESVCACVLVFSLFKGSYSRVRKTNERGKTGNFYNKYNRLAAIPCTTEHVTNVGDTPGSITATVHVALHRRNPIKLDLNGFYTTIGF